MSDDIEDGIDMTLDVYCKLDTMESTAIETVYENTEKLIGDGPMKEPLKSALEKILGLGANQCQK